MEEKLLAWIEDNFSNYDSLVSEFRKNFENSPGRITEGYKDLFSGYTESPEKLMKITLELTEPYNGFVSAVGIPFLSFCPHHFLPFFGTIDVIYEPGEYIIGIGKIPRIVDCRAKRLQIQEILVKEICEDFMNHAKAKGCIVKSSAKHICVCYRGPAKFIVDNKVSYSLGTLQEKAPIL